MRIALITASPKGKASTSNHLLNGLKTYLVYPNLEISEFMLNRYDTSLFENLLKFDTLVFAFPLYIDSIPSHLLKFLMAFDNFTKEKNIEIKNKISLYALVNNGFFDGKQNCIAIENIEHFCTSIGFIFKQGLGIGGGGMLLSIKDVPFGKGPKKSIGNALSEMALNITSNKSKDFSYVNPNFPAFLYKIIAQYNWRHSLKQNGLKFKDIHRKIPFNR